MNDSGGKQDEADGAMAPMQALEPVGGLFLALAVQADGLRHEDEQGSQAARAQTISIARTMVMPMLRFVFGGMARRRCGARLRCVIGNWSMQ